MRACVLTTKFCCCCFFLFSKGKQAIQSRLTIFYLRFGLNFVTFQFLHKIFLREFLQIKLEIKIALSLHLRPLGELSTSFLIKYVDAKKTRLKMKATKLKTFFPYFSVVFGFYDLKYPQKPFSFLVFNFFIF